MTSIRRPEKPIADPETSRVGDGAEGVAVQVAYVCAGCLLGILFVKSEVLSWYRIQEMFRFQAIHMYGVIGTALLVATAGLQMLQRFGVTTISGRPIRVAPKEMSSAGTRYWAGGAIFGLGWGLLGACPGPMFALIGAGVSALLVPVAAALAGTWCYGVVQSRLPQ